MIRSRNSSSGSSKSTVLRNTVLPLLLGVLLSTAARGQGFGPDPFQPYNQQYAPFVTPVAPGPMDYGYNNGLATGIRGANQFENYLNSLQTSAAGARAGGTGTGTPYFQANRAYDREFGRIYQPNKLADQQFEANQASVNQLYFEYLREKDPKKLRRDLPQIQPRGAGPVANLPFLGACRVHNQGHVRPGARDAPQGPRTQRERRTEISWPHRRPRPLTRRAPALDRPGPVRIRPSGRLPRH